MLNNCKSRTISRAMLVAILLSSAGLAWAESKTVLVDGAGYRVDDSMAENLRSHAGKKVTVILESGTVMVGQVKDVGKKLLYLEKLEGKEYFDALIRIDEVVAIDTRFREFRR